MTATGPTARTAARSARGPVAVVVGLLIITVLVVLVAGVARTGALDPRAYDPGGTHALTALLASRGTPVRVVDSVPAAQAAAAAGGRLVLPFPQALSDAELVQLRAFEGQLLVVAPDRTSARALGLDVAVRKGGPVRRLAPGCALSAATNAGAARVGGTTFAGPSATSCYAGSLYTEGNTTLVGSGEFLTNARLDQDGNAALSLGLLEPSTQVLWLLPGSGRDVLGQKRSLRELLPESLLEALLQLCVAVVLLALWRARRLGRVVVEPLPVVVRATEAVEGRGRLYRSAHARDRAADALRGATREAAARRLGLAFAGPPAVLVAAAAARTRRPAAELEALLYGPEPVDDASLVRLAQALSRFDSEVSSS